MLSIAHRIGLASFLVLTACAPYRSPFEGVMHCPDYPTPELQLQCQTMVLGLYQSGQNQMFSNWNKATHVEPIQSGPWLGAPQGRGLAADLPRSLPMQEPVSCNTVGTMLFCN